MMARRRRAFTLMEAIVSLGILATTLVLMGGLFTSVHQERRARQAQSRWTRSLLGAVRQIGGDVRRSVILGNWGGLYLSIPPPPEPPASLAEDAPVAETHARQETMKVRYRLEESTGRLLRQVDGGVESVVAEGVAEFEFKHYPEPGGRYVDLRLKGPRDRPRSLQVEYRRTFERRAREIGR